MGEAITSIFQSIIDGIQNLIVKITGSPASSIILGIIVFLLAFLLLKKIMGKFFWIVVVIGIVLILNGVINLDFIGQAINAVGAETETAVVQFFQ